MKKLVLFSILVICFSIKDGAVQKKSVPKKGPKKFKQCECDAAMTYLSDIWRINENTCGETKGIAGEEILKLINDHGCLMGQSASTIRKYLGKPDWIDKNGRMTYNIHPPKGSRLHCTNTDGIVFDLNKDSILTCIMIENQPNSPSGQY